MRTLYAGVTYFILVFAVGWVLGPIRELWAFGILVIAEMAGVLWVRGLSIHVYLANFRTIPGLISLPLFGLFAMVPVLVERAPRTSRGRT